MEIIQWITENWVFLSVLALVILTIQIVWGLRDHTEPATWLYLGCFALFFMATNASVFVPDPEHNLESYRLWTVYAKEAQYGAMLWMIAAVLGVAFYAMMTGQRKFSTAFMLATVLLAQSGEALEITYCQTHDPFLGMEHFYYMDGGDKPSCGRIFEDLFGPAWGWLGTWFTIILTVLPAVGALGYTLHKKHRRRDAVE